MPSYYEKHKDELKAKMREREAERRAKVKEAVKADPSVAEKEREKMRVKYHKQTESKVKRMLTACLDDMTLSATFKRFVQELIANENYKILTPASIKLMKEVSTIHNAEKERERELDFTDIFTSDADADDEGSATQDD
jgi:ATP-dependent exoDNAse (exonuclease V) beta subunit